jgi:hypothetical protein
MRIICCVLTVLLVFAITDDVTQHMRVKHLVDGAEKTYNVTVAQPDGFWIQFDYNCREAMAGDNWFDYYKDAVGKIRRP